MDISTYGYISLALGLAGEDRLLEREGCHMKQTLFSVIFNLVLCIVVTLLLLLLFLHVAI